MITNETLELSVELARKLSPAKIRALVQGLPKGSVPTPDKKLIDLLGSQTSRDLFSGLIEQCVLTDTNGDVLAGVLMGASSAQQKLKDEQSTEIVWTGPTTEFVATRRTEQVLLDVIDAAENNLLIVSFVAYDVKFIIEKLQKAVHRGVNVQLLLEASKEHGGTIEHDAAALLRDKIPGISLYGWKDQEPEYAGGRVHAKIAVADGKLAFLTSANLTGYAMEKNIEAGILIKGGEVPQQARLHLQGLIDTKILLPV
jgi:cardiolipin synthase A/B